MLIDYPSSLHPYLYCLHKIYNTSTVLKIVLQTTYSDPQNLRSCPFTRPIAFTQQQLKASLVQSTKLLTNKLTAMFQHAANQI